MKLTLIFALGLIAGFGTAWLTRQRERGNRWVLLLLPLLLLLQDTGLPSWGLAAGLLLVLLVETTKNRWSALAGATLAGLLAYSAGFRISFITSPAGGFLYLAYLSLPLTLAWVIIVSSSLRFLRTIGDARLVTQVALIAATAFLIIDLVQMRSQGPGGIAALRLAIMLDLGLLGLLLGTLARRGDLPAGGIGFILALISISGLLKVSTAFALLSPLLVLGMPLMTTSLSVVYGYARSPGAATALVPRQEGDNARPDILGIYLFCSWLSVAAVLIARFPRPGVGLALVGMALIGGLLRHEQARARGAGWRFAAGRVELLGVPLAPLRLGEAADTVELALKTGRKLVIATPDTTAVMRAQDDERLRQAYREADLVTADGMGLVWAAHFLGGFLPERVTGIDLIEELGRRAARQGYKVFLLGARPGVAAIAKKRLAQRFPGIEIVGTHHGYFRDGDATEEAVIRTINAVKPELLLVGLGVPRQELWIARNRGRLNAQVIIGVGGSLDVLAGRVRRAPLVWQRSGLEWLYRLLHQPRRLARALTIPRFLLWVLFLKLAQLPVPSVSGVSAGSASTDSASASGWTMSSNSS